MIHSLQQWLAEKRGGKIEWDELEASLIQADFGLELTDSILESCRSQTLSAETILEAVRTEIRTLWTEPPRDFLQELTDRPATEPRVVLLLGVNGTGKTTSAGKLAWHLQRKGCTPFLIGADTFRAAALEQLERWAHRLDCQVHLGTRGLDPGAAAFQGIEAALKTPADVIVIDTAGRLHNNNNLLRELEKVQRVCHKALPGAPHESLLVVDAPSGSNALRQVEEFHRVLTCSGVIVTKLDSSARGGMIPAIKSAHGLDTVFLGTGENAEDLTPFNLDTFVNAIHVEHP